MASCMSEKQLQQNNNETMNTSDDDGLKDSEVEDDTDKTQFQQAEENFNFPVYIFNKKIFKYDLYVTVIIIYYRIVPHAGFAMVTMVPISESHCAALVMRSYTILNRPKS